MDADRGPLRALEPKHLFDAVLLERCDVRDKAQGARKAWVDQQRLGFRNGIERCGEALFSQARERREVQYGIAVARAAVSTCLLYTSPSPRDGLLSRMPSSA